jgi:hypothetical protein
MNGLDTVSLSMCKSGSVTFAPDSKPYLQKSQVRTADLRVFRNPSGTYHFCDLEVESSEQHDWVIEDLQVSDVRDESLLSLFS